VKVIVTGGTGFLGLRLGRQLLGRKHLTLSNGQTAPIDSLVLADTVLPSARYDWMDGRVQLTQLEITDREAISRLIDRDDTSVFHLASIVSAQAEADLDLALKVNIEGGRAVLDALRARGGQRFVTTSSYAVFGGELPPVCGDQTKLMPQSTYGMTKAVLELLVNDYTRRGLIDGRTARLPTVIIRPGAANAAASSVASAVFRDLLKGLDYTVPVSLETRMAVGGVRTVIEGLIALHEADGVQLGGDRAVTFPSTSYSIAEMIGSLKRVARGRHLGSITVKPDAVVQAMVSSWPTSIDSSRAASIGIPAPDDLDSVIRAYIDEFVVV